MRSDLLTRQHVGADKNTILKVPLQPRHENPGAWADVDKALGVPADGKYPEFKPAGGELAAAPEQMTAFDKAMHSAGVPAYARNAALQAFHDINKSVREQIAAAENQEKAQAVAALQQKWGAAFAQKTQAAANGLKGVDGAAELDQLLKQYGLDDHPAVIRMKAGVADLRAESGGLDKGQQQTQGQLTPDEAVKKRNALEADQAFMKRYNGGDDDAIREMLRVNEAIAAGQGRRF